MQFNNHWNESFIFLCLQIFTKKFKGSAFTIFKVYPNPGKTTLIFHSFRILAAFAAPISMHYDYGSKALKTELRKLGLNVRQHLGKRSLCSHTACFLANTWILKISSA